MKFKLVNKKKVINKWLIIKLQKKITRVINIILLRDYHLIMLKKEIKRKNVVDIIILSNCFNYFFYLLHSFII